MSVSKSRRWGKAGVKIKELAPAPPSICAPLLEPNALPVTQIASYLTLKHRGIFLWGSLESCSRGEVNLLITRDSYTSAAST